MFQVIYSDDDILVIDKPPHLVTDQNSTSAEPSLAEILQKNTDLNDLPDPTDFADLERGGVVHRLDKDTSGLLLIARNLVALENLQAQFQSRQVKKQYLALVHGQTDKEGRVEGGIMRNPENREKFIVHQSGKEAITEFKLEKSYLMSDETITDLFPDFNKIQLKKLITINYKQYTLLRLFPQTGRTHQIRVHLKHIGFPIVSDDKYGGRKVVRLDHRWCPRQFLHAAKIEFKHPQTGVSLSLESPLPEDLLSALGNLKSV